MAEYYNIVSWSNSKEWLDVCDKLNPNNKLEHKKEALDKLMVWKARCPFLPSGIESTITLQEVILKDATISDTSDVATDQLLRLSYSTAIMRFINHMFDGETAKGTSLYQAAINLNVPSWVVDLRHDTAHSNTLPTLQLLRDASEISFNWLYDNYWLKHKPFINDYVTSDKVDLDENDYKIGALMNFSVSLSACANSKSKIKNLAEIPDTHMQESILNDAYELFGSTIDLSCLKTTSIISLINLMTAQSKKLIQGKDATSLVNKALLREDSLILSLELLKQLDHIAIVKRKSLSKHYVQCFEVLLTFLHTNDILQDFILELLNLTRKDGLDHNKSLLAALWISEILKGLKKSRDFAAKMKNVTPDKYPRKKKDLKSLYHHWFPNDNNSALTLDLEKPVPQDLTNIQFIQPLISTYNPYLTYFIRNLLHLIQPPLPKMVIDNICKLSELIAFPDKFPTISSPKIYTTEDLEINVTSKMESTESDCEIVVEPCEVSMHKEEPENNTRDGIWKITTMDENWSSCPIGVLPYHEAMDMDIS